MFLCSNIKEWSWENFTETIMRCGVCFYGWQRIYFNSRYHNPILFSSKLTYWITCVPGSVFTLTSWWVLCVGQDILFVFFGFFFVYFARSLLSSYYYTTSFGCVYTSELNRFVGMIIVWWKSDFGRHWWVRS